MPPSRPRSARRRSRARLAGTVVALALLASACGGAAAAERPSLRLGYFPTVTQAPALVGLEEGILADALGPVRLEATPFSAGPGAVEALFSSAIDAAYVGPNPAINAHVQSDGEAIRLVAGSTSGGAALVVRPGIADAADLRGATLATPQLGNTQDVALRAWLADRGLSTDAAGGGAVEVVPQDSGLALDAFQSGTLDGAWVPEPWVTRFVREGGGRVLVDERDVWPDGRYPTALLVVRAEYLAEHPDVVADLVAGHAAAVAVARQQPARAQRATEDAIAAVAGASLPEGVVAAAWRRLEFTLDPLAAQLADTAADARAAGLLDEVDLAGLVDRRPLAVAQGEGRP